MVSKTFKQTYKNVKGLYSLSLFHRHWKLPLPGQIVSKKCRLLLPTSVSSWTVFQQAPNDTTVLSHCSGGKLQRLQDSWGDLRELFQNDHLYRPGRSPQVPEDHRLRFDQLLPWLCHACCERQHWNRWAADTRQTIIPVCAEKGSG